MKYRPIIGITLLLLSIAAEFILPGKLHRTGAVFAIAFVVVWFWSTRK